MYEQISRNKWKSLFLVLFFLVLIFGLTWVFGELTGFGPYGLVLAIAIAVAMTFGSYYASDKKYCTFKCDYLFDVFHIDV